MTAIRALRVSVLDFALLAFGSSITAWAVLVSMHTDPAIGLGLLMAIALFAGAVAAFALVPHIAIAATIAYFALLPAIKILALPWIGGSKDLIVFAAAVAAGLSTLQRAALRRSRRLDRWVVLLVGFILVLYVLNVGGGFNPSSFGVAWFHGVRLVAEPLLLLLVGLNVDEPRRVLRWAIGSLVATASFVACVGLLQQLVGGQSLVDLGYEWDRNVRTIQGHLRSFGTLEEPFAYTAFLLSGLAALMFTRRWGGLAPVAGVVIAAGIVVSFVRTAAVIGLALAGLWLVRRRQVVAAFLLIATACVSAVAFLSSASATESRTVRGNASTYLTVNGRTDAWQVALGEPMDWVFGRGVGEVGTAAERAESSFSGSRDEAERKFVRAVDSGYFAAVADVGAVGLAVLLALVARLYAMAIASARRGNDAGWVALAVLSVLVLDATTRASFTAFPTAFVALLLIGLALAATEPPTAMQPGLAARPVHEQRRRRPQSLPA